MVPLKVLKEKMNGIQQTDSSHLNGHSSSSESLVSASGREASVVATLTVGGIVLN